LVTAWRLAAWPTSRSSSVNATTEGVVRPPSEFSITRAWLPSMMATQEFVVPRSIPMTLAMLHSPFERRFGDEGPGRPLHRIPGPGPCVPLTGTCGPGIGRLYRFRVFHLQAAPRQRDGVFRQHVRGGIM